LARRWRIALAVAVPGGFVVAAADAPAAFGAPDTAAATSLAAVLAAVDSKQSANAPSLALCLAPYLAP